MPQVHIVWRYFTFGSAEIKCELFWSKVRHFRLVLRKDIIKLHAYLNSTLDGAKRTSKVIKLVQSERSFKSLLLSGVLSQGVERLSPITLMHSSSLRLVVCVTALGSRNKHFHTLLNSSHTSRARRCQNFR